MKTLFSILLLTTSVIAHDLTDTELIEMGIDAGINACIVRGVPRNKYALEVDKAHAKALIQAIYPEINWQWSSPQPLDPIKVGKIEGEQIF